MTPCGRLSTSIMRELQLPHQSQSEGELRLALTNHISSQACFNGILLIVDEADAWPVELMEEIRILANVVVEGEPRVRILLAGGPGLEELVGHPRLESLNQQVVGRLFLDNFSPEETRDYVSARINACGAEAESVPSQRSRLAHGAELPPTPYLSLLATHYRDSLDPFRNPIEPHVRPSQRRNRDGFG